MNNTNKEPDQMWHAPSAADQTIIKEQAREVVGYKRIIIEPGYRYNLTDDDMHANMNVRLVDSTEDWEESDLWGHATWKDFAAGFELTKDGQAEIDLYISQSTHGLLTNLVVFFDQDGLIKIEEPAAVRGDGLVWSRSSV